MWLRGEDHPAAEAAAILFAEGAIRVRKMLEHWEKHGVR